MNGLTEFEITEVEYMYFVGTIKSFQANRCKDFNLLF